MKSLSCVRLLAIPWTAAYQAPCPWDFPGKNTGVGFHFLLQCMKVKSQSEVSQSCLTLSDPMDCSLPGSSFQAKLLEWGAIAFSKAKKTPCRCASDKITNANHGQDDSKVHGRWEGFPGGSDAGDRFRLWSWRTLPAAEQLGPSATTIEPVL